MLQLVVIDPVTGADLYIVNPPPTTVVRIRRSEGRVVQDCDTYIGRAWNQGGWRLLQSPWHNPFPVSRYGAEAIPLYRQYILTSPLRFRLEELRGKRLGCWCSPQPCHGDILLELLNWGTVDIQYG